jgi:hypothetical protein
MAKIVSDEIEIRAQWPLSRFGGRRVSYGIPLNAVAYLGLAGILALYFLGGHNPWTLTLSWAPVIAIVLTTWAGSYYDGTMILANREHIAFTRWFRQVAVVPTSEVSRIVRLTVDDPTQYGKAPRPAIFLFNRDGRCVLSLFSTRFDDGDLARLWATLGIQPEGSLHEHVNILKLNDRFPRAFDKPAG